MQADGLTACIHSDLDTHNEHEAPRDQNIRTQKVSLYAARTRKSPLWNKYTKAEV